jgi:hypothetical protein
MVTKNKSKNIQEALTAIQKSNFGSKKKAGQVMELLEEIKANRDYIKSKSKKKTKQIEPQVVPQRQVSSKHPQVLQVVSLEQIKTQPRLVFDNEITENQSIQMLNRYKQCLARMQVKPKIGNELLEIATG